MCADGDAKAFTRTDPSFDALGTKNGRQAVRAVVERRSASCRPCENRPRGSADATRHMQVPCQTRIWGELGICRTNWADLPQPVERFAPVGGAIRTSGWSDLPHPPRPQGSASRLDRPRQFHPETPLGRAPCDALPSVRSRMPRGAQVSDRGDGRIASSRRRPDRRGHWRKWTARARRQGRRGENRNCRLQHSGRSCSCLTTKRRKC